MRLLQAPKPSNEDLSSPLCGLTAEVGQSRHDAQMLNSRQVPADPYAAWLEQREAERRSAASTEEERPACGRFIRTRPITGRRAAGSQFV